MKYSVYTSGRFPLLNIDNIGFSNNPQITSYGPAIRIENIIIYILNGKGYFNNQLLCKGQGFIIPSNAPHEYISSPAEPWTILWITATDLGITSLFKYYDYNTETGIFDFDFADDLTDVKNKIKENNSSNISRAEMLELYMQIFKHHTSKKKYSTSFTNEQKYIDYATSYIHSNFQHRISVSDITKALGISQPYLFRIFKKNLNISPMEYIQEYRITTAMRLLLETEYTVDVIAQSVGYSDSHNFSKSFKERKGFSPCAYRRMERNNCNK